MVFRSLNFLKISYLSSKNNFKKGQHTPRVDKYLSTKTNVFTIKDNLAISCRIIPTYYLGRIREFLKMANFQFSAWIDNSENNKRDSVKLNYHMQNNT